MFGFLKSKRADVLSHWYTPVPNFNISTQDFYTAVEKELKTQQVPGLEISQVEFSEGGLLSDKRTYLRMTRERLVFDVCAAPFGANYFFSCRFAELPAVVKLWQLAVLVVGFLALVALFWKLLGFWLGSIALAAFLLLIVYLLRNAVAMGLKDLDASFIKSPLFGPVYEAWFRKESYYRQDTRLMYLTVVEGIIKKLVEQETAAKGVKLLTQYEYGPILGELYKPHPFPVGQKPESS
jgi:hypothetical protein